MDDALQVCHDIDLSESARAMLRPGQSIRSFIDSLIEEEQHADAVRVLARALPKPAAVRWACRCVRQLSTELAEPSLTALAQAEQWAAEPNEANRRAAKLAADRVGMQDPAGVVAMAAFLSEGSLAPPHLPAVPPAEHLTARAVAGAILLAVAGRQPGDAADCYSQCLALGLQALSP